jgi:hypothetical protein
MVYSDHFRLSNESPPCGDLTRGPCRMRTGGNRAFYVPAEDYVQVPPPAAYFEPISRLIGTARRSMSLAIMP